MCLIYSYILPIHAPPHNLLSINAKVHSSSHITNANQLSMDCNLEHLFQFSYKFYIPQRQLAVIAPNRTHTDEGHAYNIVTIISRKQ